MKRFQKNTETVLDYTLECTGKTTAYWLSHSCLKQLEQYLLSDGLVEYSPKVASRWLSKQEKSDMALRGYRNAIERLNDVYQTGHVCFSNRIRSRLNEAFRGILNEYLAEVSEKYAASHLCNIENRCRFFLCYVEMDRSATSPDSLTYEDILAFLEGPLSDLCKADTCMYKGAIMRFLYWMYERGTCTAGFSMILKHKRASKVLLLKDLPKWDVSSIIISQESSGNGDTLSLYLENAATFCRILRECGYANTMMACARTTLDLLFLFLDMNHLQYSPATADIWVKNASLLFGTNFHMSQRVVYLFKGYIQDGSVDPTKISIGRVLLCDSLPGWCRNVMDSFLSLKHRENKAPNTIRMYCIHALPVSVSSLTGKGLFPSGKSMRNS